MKRIYSIDVARGLVMIIMALDHTRDLLHTDAQVHSPTDMAHTTPILFFTRWITHLCAPSFVFLSGTSAYLSAQRKRAGGLDGGSVRSGVSEGPDKGMRRWLLTRGIFLVILELTLVNFEIWYDIYFRTLMFQVIGTIGCGFIVLGLLYKVSPKTLGIIGLMIIFGHDLLALLPMVANPVLQFFGAFLFGTGFFKFGHLTVIIIYPVLPWLGIMLAGFASGRLFGLPDGVRKKRLLTIGWAALGLFVLLRAANVYGDPSHWKMQKDAVFTFLSFMNVSKYPPSLLYTLVMLGLLFLFLAFMDGKENVFTRVVSVYGKVPMFYYLIHWNVIHLLMLAMVFLQGFGPDQLVFGTLQFGRPPGSGISLPMVYLVWLAVVASMYPLCRWYARYKAGHPEKRWLRYL